MSQTCMPSTTNIVTPRAWDVKRVLIAVLIAAAIALFFWTQSRIPDLNTKAQMGQRTVLSGLAFDVILPVSADQPVYERVAYTAVNWTYTNWKGMTFGVLFAAAFFVILAYLPHHEFRGRTLNTLKGVVTGVPLGVCVNCTTPIAQGMYQAGVRLETVLATLVSSPTLNVIVLTMSFSLLPFEFAVTKIAGVVVFVLLVIPAVSRFGRPSFDASAQDRIEAQLEETPYRTSVIEPVRAADQSCDIDDLVLVENAGWLSAARDVGTDFMRALWFVFRTMVPFMLLAGVLGAAVIETVPVDALVTLPNSFLVAFAVAVIGVFLPVPIAFDVVIVSLLIANGVPVLFSMTLLFVLGIFSVYPFMILWRNVGPAVAQGLFLGATVVGLVCGYALQTYEQWDRQRVIAAYDAITIEQPDNPSVTQLEPATAQPTNASTQEVHARNITIATRICEQQEHPMAQLLCFDDFMSSEFKKGSDESLCKSWHGPDALQIRDYCLGNLTKHRIFKDAEQRRDMNICLGLAPGPAQSQCNQRVILARITAGAGIDICRELPTSQLIFNCQQQGMSIRLDKFNDHDSCEQFERPQDVNACFANVKVQEASKGRRLDNCETLGNLHEQNSCKRIVAFGMIDDGADRSVCDVLSDTTQRQDCIAHSVTISAAKAGDPELCDALEQGQLLAVCRRVAVDRQISYEISKAAAAHISLAISELPKSGHVPIPEDAVPNNSNTMHTASPFYSGDGIRISRIPFREKRSTGRGFTRESAIDYGIGDVWKFSLLEFVSPFIAGRGIAAGDIDNDHLPDVVLASNDGIHLFRNTGTGRFSELRIQLEGKVPSDVYVVALVDVDNDGWQDIFATGYGGRVSVVLNDGNGFKNPRSFDIANPDTNLTTAAGFSDLDLDGDLDILLGNWSFGEDKSFLENYSGNRLLENAPGGFKSKPIDEVRGDSLSVLFSDFNHDGSPDLAVGNDREIPDVFYLGGESGTLKRIRPTDDRVPVTPINTMSIESADFNNDLRLDLFSTDMTFSEGPQLDYCDAVDDENAESRCRMLLATRERISRRDTSSCEKLPDSSDRSACITAIYRAVVIDSKQPELCEKIPDSLAPHRLYCQNLARSDVRETTFSIADNIPQVQSNILLMGDSSGQFRDATKDYGVESSFWSWNAKAADFDNDGWQDIYVGNGFRFGEGAWEIHSNVFFHNQKGERFTTAQAEFGLEDFNNTPSYVAIDFDFDGDLDILSTGPLSPPRLFINQESANGAISFALRDHRGNRFGIGSKITIHYQEDGEAQHQLRELKASGGFMSFDAPRAHFGLGRQSFVSRLEIDWSNGGKTIIDESFPVGGHYVIVRE